MRVWKCEQVVDFDQSTTAVKEERNKTLQQKTTDKYNRFHIVTLSKTKTSFYSPNFPALWQKAIKQATINHLKSIDNFTILVLIYFGHINLQSTTAYDSFTGLFLHIFRSFNALNSSFTFSVLFSVVA